MYLKVCVNLITTAFPAEIKLRFILEGPYFQELLTTIKIPSCHWGNVTLHQISTVERQLMTFTNTNLSLRDSCGLLSSTAFKSDAFFVFWATLLGFSTSIRPLTPLGFPYSEKQTVLWNHHLQHVHCVLNSFITTKSLPWLILLLCE